ncbi:bleomycin resistance protein [Streptomyces candidus]|uniref:VOC family protein n=1 Tax=Streptomyces candidus TaxID=67283 RepID=A0A7X0HI03_9ACTN|nr:VOC family protein [Streptomyces candidus]MBB6438006.1 hypothetical protein [Streptomyces candidus]GHH39657.1 hypothetical protein GCM10018773_19920 [Streptomyces candidus]
MAEKTIPILPCPHIQPVVDFYTVLGFTTTYQQNSPNPYAEVERGGIRLQFFGMKKYDPTQSYSSAYIVSDGVDALYEDFRGRLKEAYGRIPARGLPRIGALRDMSFGMRQFLVSDPGGNCLRFGQPAGEDLTRAPSDTFGRAMYYAARWVDAREHLAGAAQLLDRTLAITDEQPTPVQVFEMLVMRADVAFRSDCLQEAAGFLDRARTVRLGSAEQAAVRDELRRSEEIREALLGPR